jgi:hypothetical protein
MASDAATLRILIGDRGVTGLEVTGSLRQQARALRLGSVIMPALALLDATLAGSPVADDAPTGRTFGRPSTVAGV